MIFLIDYEKKIIFVWSAKCGCTHVKNIFAYLTKNTTLNNDALIHKLMPVNKAAIPNNIEEYTTILFIRNPYKRLVSGFLNKYNNNGEFRHRWKHPNITFNSFINNLIKKNWDVIEYHHFIPQTSETFDKNKIMKSKNISIFDIENINYKYIEELYNTTIPESIINFKGSHLRKKYDAFFGGCVSSLDMNKYINYNVNVNQFYNEEIKQQVYNFYKSDFDFFGEHGFNYTI